MSANEFCAKLTNLPNIDLLINPSLMNFIKNETLFPKSFNILSRLLEGSTGVFK